MIAAQDGCCPSMSCDSSLRPTWKMMQHVTPIHVTISIKHWVKYKHTHCSVNISTDWQDSHLIYRQVWRPYDHLCLSPVIYVLVGRWTSYQLVQSTSVVHVAVWTIYLHDDHAHWSYGVCSQPSRLSQRVKWPNVSVVAETDHSWCPAAST